LFRLSGASAGLALVLFLFLAVDDDKDLAAFAVLAVLAFTRFVLAVAVDGHMDIAAIEFFVLFIPLVFVFLLAPVLIFAGIEKIGHLSDFLS